MYPQITKKINFMNNNEEKRKGTTLLTVGFSIVAFVTGAYLFGGEYEDLEISESCNVLAFSLNGYLSTYIPSNALEYDLDITSSENIMDGISWAQNNPQIKSVLLSIDSGGGDAVAGEEVANALKEFDKPSVAVIRGLGASAAYWASTGADKIYTSKLSEVGGIGITASYLDETVKNSKDGYTYVNLVSAPYKDLGDPNKSLSTQERALIMRDIQKMHDIFVDDISINRNIERSDVDQMSDGMTFLGIDALSAGLTDEIGSLADATRYLEEQMGQGAEVCWF